jgi:hypothetical protein
VSDIMDVDALRRFARGAASMSRLADRLEGLVRENEQLRRENAALLARYRDKVEQWNHGRTSEVWIDPKTGEQTFPYSVASEPSLPKPGAEFTAVAAVHLATLIADERADDNDNGDQA